MSVYRKTRDQPLPASFDQPAWRARHVAFADGNVPKWTAAVAEKYGNNADTTTTTTTRYGVVGYCFGAPYVCNLLAGTDTTTTTVNISAGAFAHPTLLKEEHFTCISKPILLSCAENDHAFPTEARNKAVDVLQRDQKVYHLQLFQGVAHGFATRADLNDPYQCKWPPDQSVNDSMRSLCSNVGVAVVTRL